MARRVPQGPAPEPAVQKLRVRYAKRGRMRFTSTRDFQRALERAVRRARVPTAFSAGFHPHPRISYANAAPTGAASEAEYVEISLTRSVDPERVARDLDAALPHGLDVLDVVVSPPGALADELQASLWRMEFAVQDRDRVRAAVAALLTAQELVVTRTMRQGPRDLDVRAAVVSMLVVAADGDGDTAAPGAPGSGQGGTVVEATVRHTVPTIRPEEIWRAMGVLDGEGLPRPVCTRLRQGPLGSDGTVLDLPG